MTELSHGYAELVTLADEAARRNDWTGAMDHAAKAVQWCRTHLGPRHLELANALVRLALLENAVEGPPVMQVRGRTQWAFAVHLREAVNIQRQVLGKHAPLVAATLLRLAGMLYGRRSFAESTRPYREYLSIQRATFGRRHPNVAIALGALAVAYHSQSNYEEAAKRYRRALAIWAASPPHPEAATTFANFGQMLYATKDFTAAYDAYVQALKLRQTTARDANSLVIADLLRLAQAARSMHRIQDALGWYREALSLQKLTLGNAHPDVAETLYGLGVTLAAHGPAEEAFACLREAIAVDRTWLQSVLAEPDPSARRRALRAMTRRSQALLALALGRLRNHPEVVAEAFQVLVGRKEYVQALGLPAAPAASRLDPSLAAKQSELRRLKGELAHRNAEGPCDRSAEAWFGHALRTRELRHRIDTMERELRLADRQPGRKERETGADMSSPVDIGEIARALPPGSALIEFMRVDLDFQAVASESALASDAARYGAMVLVPRPRSHGPDWELTMVDLGEADRIELATATYRSAVGGSRGAWRHLIGVVRARHPSVDEAGAALSSRLFEPLLPLLGSARRLLVSPDSFLHHLSLAALPRAEGRYVIDDFHVSYVTSAADVLRWATSIGTPAPDLVVADPDFDLRDPAPPSHTARPQPSWGPPSLWFDSLTGARAEGRAVSKRLGATLWLGDQALKRRLREWHSPRILHLATHGFFLGERGLDAEGSPSDRELQASPPLGDRFTRLAGGHWGLDLHSGLALAGANTWLAHGKTPVDAENGLLTAADIAGLDLSGTELVVLSACDTGLGHVDRPEGIVGLRGAIAAAGARTLIASLWKVPDYETRMLMQRFYDHLLSNVDRSEALRLAQLEIKRTQAHPLYWGAFVCQGEFSPLRNVTV